MKRLRVFLRSLVRMARTPDPIINGEPYHFGVIQLISLAWYISDDPNIDRPMSL